MSSGVSMMTPLDFYFYTIFGAGCVLAGVLSLIASGCRWLSAALLLATAICIFWSGLLSGLEIGFRAWQAIPNPPEEAYSDSGPSIVLVGGWIPGTIFCMIVFLCGQLFHRFLNWTRYCFSKNTNSHSKANAATSGTISRQYWAVVSGFSSVQRTNVDDANCACLCLSLFDRWCRRLKMWIKLSRSPLGVSLHYCLSSVREIVGIIFFGDGSWWCLFALRCARK